MNGVLFTLIFAVVLAAAMYSRLPLTIICMTSMVAFMSALTPHGEPLNTILQIVRIPAAVVADFGTAAFGISAPYSAAILLMGTLLVDIGLTNMLGLRR